MTSAEGSLLAVYGYSALGILGYISFFICFIASILYLIKRKKKYYLFAGATAETGVILICLTLITGVCLGYAAQNMSLAWDYHLTKTFILWLLYIGYLIVRPKSMAKNSRTTVSAVFGIIAFLYVPIVFFSINLWRSGHPIVIAAKNDASVTTQSMQQIGVIGVLVSALLWIFLFTGRYRLLKKREKRAAKLIILQR